MAWYAQRSNRAKGWYYEVIWKLGKERTSVSLGYLGEEDVARMNNRVGSCPAPSIIVVRVGAQGVEQPPPDAVRNAVRRWLLDDSAEAIDVVLEQVRQEEALRTEKPGNYGEMRLSDFYERVFGPRRKSTNPATYEREKHRWKVIIHHLGHLQINRLNALHWDRFLMGQTTWGGTSKRIAQNEYRQLLKYAKKIGAIEQVHPFEPIEGSTQRQGVVQPLTREEIPRVLNEARSPMRRALFAVALGQGTRRSEVTRLRWEHVFWERGEILIPGTKNRRAKAEVPLTPLTRLELERWWIEQGCPKEGLCFTWGGEPVGNWRKSFISACARAGVTRRVFPNLCRHTFATQMALNDVPKAAARVLMRHSKLSPILEESYENVSNDEAAEAIAKMPDYKGSK